MSKPIYFDCPGCVVNKMKQDIVLIHAFNTSKSSMEMFKIHFKVFHPQQSLSKALKQIKAKRNTLH